MPNQDITTILTDAELASLRAGYSDAFMAAGARNALIARLPRCAPLIDADMDLFYRADYGSQPYEIGTDGREKVVLTALAVSGNWEMAGIHIYWALCLPGQPLSPAQLGEVIMLAGTYSGVQVISMGLAACARIFGLLKTAVAEDLTSSQYVVPLLLGEPVAAVKAQAKADRKAAAKAQKAPKPAKSKA